MRDVIARLKELHEKASPPDWSVEEGWTPDDERFCHIEGWTDEAEHGEWPALKRADADLTVEMRNNLPAILRYVSELEKRPTYDPRLEPFHPRLRVWIPKRTKCELGHNPGRLYCNPSNPEICFDDNDQPYIEADCYTCQDLRHLVDEEEPGDG